VTESNIDVLAGAGTLGAILALIDLQCNDVPSVRDAALALAQMVKRDYIKDRFLQVRNHVGGADVRGGFRPSQEVF
jgi:hypothetical protein